VAQNSGIRCDALDENGEYTTYYDFIHGLRIVDLSNVGYKDDPWVLGNRVA
jgi:hypothetical protein